MSDDLDPIASVLSTLELREGHARTTEDIFTGDSEPMPNGRVYGGQVLGQCVIAAQRTIDGRDIHSLHGYFVRPGNPALPITFAVERIHDGRSFATRRVQAYQEGVPIFSMIASFQTADEGIEHQAEMPTGLPQPEDLPSPSDSLGTSAEHPAAAWFLRRPFEMRGVDQPIWVTPADERVARQAIWFRAVGPVPDDPHMHTALLAYASDYSLLQPVFRRHGLSFMARNTRTASLDHAMWFHRPARVDDWLLYAQDSPNASGGRGLAFGRIFTRDGRLVASVAQEGMVRVLSRP